MQAGQDESRFWVQTFKSFDTVLAGFRGRLEREREDRLDLAWDTAALTAAAMAGKLKPLNHYRKRRTGGRQTPQEMLAVMRSFQAKGAKMTITRIKRQDTGG